MTTQSTTTPAEPLDANARALLVLTRSHERIGVLERELRALRTGVDEATELLYGAAIDWHEATPRLAASRP
jgi:hypothetical protein